MGLDLHALADAALGLEPGERLALGAKLGRWRRANRPGAAVMTWWSQARWRRTLLGVATLHMSSCAGRDRTLEEGRVFGAAIDALGLEFVSVDDRARSTPVNDVDLATHHLDADAWDDLQRVLDVTGLIPAPIDLNTTIEFGDMSGTYPYVGFTHAGFDERFQNAVVVRGMYSSGGGEWWVCGLKRRGAKWRVTDEFLESYSEGWD